MPTSSNYDLRPASEEEQAYLESLIREDFEQCHPGETLEYLKRRASFSKEDTVAGLDGDSGEPRRG
jgi:hypothetical protein